MADENLEVKDEVPNTNEQEAVDPTQAAEDQAREQGWRPKEEWDGDPAEWRDARSFLDRGELLNKISSQSKEIKEMRKVVSILKDHNDKVSQTEFNRAIAFLKSQKKDALEAGDHAQVLALDDKLDEVKDKQAEQKALAARQAVAQEIHPDFAAWVDKNAWYAQNTEMKEAADAIGSAYAKANQDKDPSEVLKYVTTRIKTVYPEKFANVNKDKPSTVDTGNGTTRSASASKKASSDSTADLTEDEIRVMNTLVKGGHITKEKYLKDIGKYEPLVKSSLAKKTA